MELIVTKYDYDYFDNVDSYVNEAIREFWVEKTKEAIAKAETLGLPIEDDYTEILWIEQSDEDEIDNMIKVSEQNWRTWEDYNGELAEAFHQAVDTHEEEYARFMEDYYDEPDR